MEDQHVNCGNKHRQKHDRESSLEERVEGNDVTLRLGQTNSNNIRRRSNQGSISAKACACSYSQNPCNLEDERKAVQLTK